MLARRVVLMLLTAVGPMSAQSTEVPGIDFWVGAGRLVRNSIDLLAPKADPPDLSGSYQVSGRGVDTTKEYSTTLDIKRWRTLTTPFGAKFNEYEITWNWSNGATKGIGVFLGSRLYVQYGSERAALHVIAPLALAPEEKQQYREFWDAKARLKKGESFKNPPWLKDLTFKYEPVVHDIYYDLWFTPKGGYGQEFVNVVADGEPMTAWTEGVFVADGNYIQNDGHLSWTGSGGVRNVDYYVNFWHVSQHGDNFTVLQRQHPVLKPNAKEEEDDLDGGAFAVGDGTVVMLLGGNPSAGYGYYEIRGKTLVGPYAERDGSGQGDETLVPSAQVLAKNPKLFKP
jgi:hypothetical protein